MMTEAAASYAMRQQSDAVIQNCRPPSGCELSSPVMQMIDGAASANHSQSNDQRKDEQLRQQIHSQCHSNQSSLVGGRRNTDSAARIVLNETSQQTIRLPEAGCGGQGRTATVDGRKHSDYNPTCSKGHQMFSGGNSIVDLKPPTAGADVAIRCSEFGHDEFVRCVKEPQKRRAADAHDGMVQNYSMPKGGCGSVPHNQPTALGMRMRGGCVEDSDEGDWMTQRRSSRMSKPFPVESRAGLGYPGHYAAYCRLLHNVCLRHHSIQDRRVRILLLVLRWLKQQRSEQVHPSRIFLGRQFERLLMQTRVYMQLLMQQKPMTKSQLLQLGISASLGFEPNMEFIEAVAACGMTYVHKIPTWKQSQQQKRREASVFARLYDQQIVRRLADASDVLKRQVEVYRALEEETHKLWLEQRDVSVPGEGWGRRCLEGETRESLLHTKPFSELRMDVYLRRDNGRTKYSSSCDFQSSVDLSTGECVQQSMYCSTHDNATGTEAQSTNEAQRLSSVSATARSVRPEKGASTVLRVCGESTGVLHGSEREDTAGELWDIGGVSSLARNYKIKDQPLRWYLRVTQLQQRILALASLQERVRREVVGQRLLEQHPPALHPLHNIPVRTTRKHRLLRALRDLGDKATEHKQQQQHLRHQMLQTLLDTHRRGFLTYHREIQRQIRRLAAVARRRRVAAVGDAALSGVNCGHPLHPADCGCLHAANIAAIKRRERLDALKKHDETAYLNLLQETKNQRLLQLVRQTESFMQKIGSLVIEQREREGLDVPVEVGAAPTDGGDNTSLSSSFMFSKERYYKLTHSRQEKVTELPSCLKGGTLRSYQMEGLNWLVSLYNNGLNGILADCMGLGKTVQTVSFLAYLHEKKNVRNPHLILAPLSTLHGNWRLEFKKWWPSLRIAVYEGTKEVRKALRNRITAGYRGDSGNQESQRFLEPLFDVLLTTDAFILRDRSFLKKIQWEYLIVDEAHRLKNPNSKLVQTLSTGFSIKRRIALTGTPLQNDIVEVWALMNFLMPSIFNAKLNFEQWLNLPLGSSVSSSEEPQHVITVTEEEKLLIIDRLHKVLRPFLLRREKAEVADELPSKQEEIVWCPLSGIQKILYRLVEDSPIGHNRMVQLRKVCNHPFLFCFHNFTPDESLVRCCGKFAMLDVLLPALKASGHRVLVFSQMTKLLDLLEAYLSLRGYSYLRLDGGTSSEERQTRLTLYNEDHSPYFLFILSTKAGGLGVNLQSADTVIIFDSDWNPQNDEQAQCRAHRIGQKKEVLTIRFVTPSSIEEQILHSAELKLDKDALVIKSGMYNGELQDRESERQEQVREILRRRKQLEANLTRPFDFGILKRQLARTPRDGRIFETVDRLRRLLHVPGLIYPEVLPPCLFQWSKTVDRCQVDLVSNKHEAEQLWKQIYSAADYWTTQIKKKPLPDLSLTPLCLIGNNSNGASTSIVHSHTPPMQLIDSSIADAAQIKAKKTAIECNGSGAADVARDSTYHGNVAGRTEHKHDASAMATGNVVIANNGGNDAAVVCSVQHYRSAEYKGQTALVSNCTGDRELVQDASAVICTERKTTGVETVELKTYNDTKTVPTSVVACFGEKNIPVTGEGGAGQREKQVVDEIRPGTNEDPEDEDATQSAAAAPACAANLVAWKAVLNSSISQALNDAIQNKMYDAFVELPSRALYKDYYDRVKKPICLLHIRKYSDRQEFTSLHKLEKYLTRLAENARAYNGQESILFLRVGA